MILWIIGQSFISHFIFIFVFFLAAYDVWHHDQQHQHTNKSHLFWFFEKVKRKKHKICHWYIVTKIFTSCYFQFFIAIIVFRRAWDLPTVDGLLVALQNINQISSKWPFKLPSVWKYFWYGIFCPCYILLFIHSLIYRNFLFRFYRSTSFFAYSITVCRNTTSFGTYIYLYNKKNVGKTLPKKWWCGKTLMWKIKRKMN